MAGCMLRASGPTFDAAGFLYAHPLSGAEPRGNELAACVSERDGDDFLGQAADAEAFLTGNAEFIRRLASTPGVAAVELDFGLWLLDAPCQSFTLPASLACVAGSLGVSMELSFYAASES